MAAGGFGRAVRGRQSRHRRGHRGGSGGGAHRRGRRGCRGGRPVRGGGRAWGARLETLPKGKPLFESNIDVGMTVETLRYYAGWADKLGGRTLQVDGPFLAYTLREPTGGGAALGPW